MYRYVQIYTERYKYMCVSLLYIYLHAHTSQSLQSIAVGEKDVTSIFGGV